MKCLDCTVPEELKSQLENGVVKNGAFLNIECGNGFSNPHSTRSCIDGEINPSFEDSPAKCQKGKFIKEKNRVTYLLIHMKQIAKLLHWKTLSRLLKLLSMDHEWLLPAKKGLKVQIVLSLPVKTELLILKMFNAYVSLLCLTLIQFNFFYIVSFLFTLMWINVCN